jgi:hypothetical protein
VTSDNLSNRVLLLRGKGHALTHGYHGAAASATDARRFIPSFGPAALASMIAAFMLGGWVVSVASDVADPDRIAQQQSIAT